MKGLTYHSFTLSICLFALLQGVHAQDAFSMSTQVFQDGAPKYASTVGHYEEMDGSPYIYDKWSTGDVKLSDGKAYKNLYLKYDELADMVIFKYSITDSAMAFAVPAVEFRFSFISNDNLHNARFLNGFEPVDGTTTASFFQVLAGSKTMLLKKTVKRITKHPVGYNATEASSSITESTTYYLAKNKKPVRISASNRAVIFALGDKGDKVKQYIADNKLNAKNDDDFAKIIDYYNSI